jgi:hypothetical protein
MDKKKKKFLLLTLIVIATAILISVGSTFAYFTAMVGSPDNAVSLTAAVFQIDLEDDISLIKSQVIPSQERYVDLAINRLDENGEFIKPYEEDGKMVRDYTACIDDNENEICSIYTFTVINPIADMDIPVQISIKPTINTFTNMKYKVVKTVQNELGEYEVVQLTEGRWLTDDRYEINSGTGEYVKDAEGNKIEKPNFSSLPISTITIEGIKETIPKAKDSKTPGRGTFSIIMWVDEINQDQTTQDSGQVFAGTLIVDTATNGGNGITGVFSAGGVDNE